MEGVGEEDRTGKGGMEGGGQDRTWKRGMEGCGGVGGRGKDRTRQGRE
jgi:hypothetical protein